MGVPGCGRGKIQAPYFLSNKTQSLFQILPYMTVTCNCTEVHGWKICPSSAEAIGTLMCGVS